MVAASPDQWKREQNQEFSEFFSFTLLRTEAEVDYTEQIHSKPRVRNTHNYISKDTEEEQKWDNFVLLLVSLTRLVAAAKTVEKASPTNNLEDLGMKLMNGYSTETENSLESSTEGFWLWYMLQRKFIYEYNT